MCIRDRKCGGVRGEKTIEMLLLVVVEESNRNVVVVEEIHGNVVVLGEKKL